jgi:hypothetical protein
MFLSEVTFGELMKGLHRLPEGPRRSRLKRRAVAPRRLVGLAGVG